MWEIHNKYGLRDKKDKDLWAWGTNDYKKAKETAKTFDADVINFEKLGKKMEAEGVPVNYLYKKYMKKR